MNRAFLVADSGGTQTDWCYVDPTGTETNFTTKSFHPVHWNAAFEAEFHEFWSQRSAMLKADVYFFGAGCLHQANQQKLEVLFHNWGFESVQISSDIHAACHASLGNTEGVVGIMGTGSIVCHFDGKDVKQIHGGLGYLIGDEGSGYYFGRLALNQYLNNVFSASLTNAIEQLIGGRAKVLEQVYSSEGKQFIGSIAALLGNLEQTEELVTIHRQNIEKLVLQHILPLKVSRKKMAIIGRYGYVQQQLIREILAQYEWEVDQFIDKPIFRLTDYIRKSTF